MWKILFITFLCHQTQAAFYTEFGKLIELKITPNNGVLDYNEEKGEITVLTSIGIYGSIDTPLYYNYIYENDETGDGGSGYDRLCGNTYSERKREDQRLHSAIMNILRGDEICPMEKGEKYQVQQDFAFPMYDNTDGILITCGNNTAEITLTGISGKENMGTIKFTYYLRGEKCDN